MPLILIHGDHQSKSRQELVNQIAKAKLAGITDIVSLDGKSVSLTDIIQTLESNSLFGEIKRLTILENLFRRRSKTELNDIIEYLTSLTDVHLILWEDKLLSATQTKPLSQFRKLAFPLPKVIFKLTDSFTPNTNLTNLLKLLQTACDSESAEFVLIMLARQLRLHIQGKNRGPRYDETTAIRLHHQLAEIDYKNKTGQLSLDLKSELVNWIVEVYQQ
jgi:hypothetical protein